MCTLAIYYRVFERYPVVIAANRDEFLERPALPPVELCRNPAVVGGKDLKAGGTWLGINEHGLAAALLNRRSDGTGDPTLRSRGILCLETLRFAEAGLAAEFAAAQCASDYNPFNLLLASRDEAYVAYNHGDRIRLVQLARGLHLLTNLDLDDFECPRISRSFELFNRIAGEGAALADSAAIRRGLASVLASHSTQLDARTSRPNSLCLHLDSYGTRSSSLILMGVALNEIEHYFAEGPPCTTPYRPALTPGARL